MKFSILVAYGSLSEERVDSSISLQMRVFK